MFKEVSAKIKEFAEKPIPMGGALVITCCVAVITAAIYKKPKVVIINRFYFPH